MIKLRRLAKLLGIAGISLGSFIHATCNGKTHLDGQSDLTEEVQDTEAEDVDAQDVAAEDTVQDTQAEEAQAEDVEEEEPDTDLWDVICE